MAYECTRPTILVVEDDALIRMYGTDVLAEAGFEVIEAGNADDALEVLHQHDDIQLLFSDVDMPGSLDGLALARLVHERWPTIRLLLTSGHHNLGAASLPDDGRFVRKPWTQDVLIAKIRDVLEQADSDQSGS